MSRIVTITITAAGAELAGRLPYEHHRARLLDTVRAEWDTADGLVLVAATGVAVRAIAPLLSDKATDPAVVCVDDTARYVVALSGGHAGGANALARQVAALLGAEAVVTTATDRRGLPALDDLPGYRAAGDVAGVTRRWLDGHPPRTTVDPGMAAWPLPGALHDVAASPDGGQVTVTDTARAPGALEVLLRPASIVVGVGASSGADESALWELLHAALAGARLDAGAVSALATLDRKASEPAIVAVAGRLGVPLKTFAASDLAAVAVPNPSAVVAAAVGTASVAEAAAILGAGPGATLAAVKVASAGRDSTVALARRRLPQGHLSVVGLGPGDAAQRTPAATAAVAHAEVVIGYDLYLDLAADLLRAGQTVVPSPIGAETERVQDALARAASGQRVALLCSGDAGVYAMASLVLELAPGYGDPPISVMAGIPAAVSGAAVLGAPIGHDHAAISLSDLLTPWDVIRRRLRAAAEGDFVVSLYNPRSQRRTSQLVEAVEILATRRPGSTPAAVLTDIGRPGQQVTRTTLADLDPAQVGMRSLVVIGSTTTRWISGHMVTPRGYPVSAT